jgi:hypothetical protein
MYRLSVFCLLLLCLTVMTHAGCRSVGAYRVVDLPHPPEVARARVEAELEAGGYRVISTANHRQSVQITAVKQRRAGQPRPPAKPPAKKRSAPTAQKPNTQKPNTQKPNTQKPNTKGPRITATLRPHGTGTRVLLAASNTCGVHPVFSKSSHRDYKVAFGLNGPKLLWEIHAGMGYRYAPGLRDNLTMEGGARIGYRFMELGGSEDRPEIGVGVGLSAGLGVGCSFGSERCYAMPSLTLSHLIRRTVEPIEGTVIPMGPEFSVDLHAVGLFNSRRTAVEGQLVVRYSDVIGLYVGAGYQWLPTRGATFTAGLYLSTLGVGLVALLSALAL